MAIHCHDSLCPKAAVELRTDNVIIRSRVPLSTGRTPREHIAQGIGEAVGIAWAEEYCAGATMSPYQAEDIAHNDGNPPSPEEKNSHSFVP